MSFETALALEKEQPIATKVVLEIMRHGKREKGATAEENARNFALPLTQDGREQAITRGKEIHPQARVALGIGSDRARAQETAYRVMLAGENISANDSFDDIEEEIATELLYGKKMIVDERLGFNLFGPIGVAGNQAFSEGKYMDWVIGESDVLAIEMGDTQSSTWARMSGGMAEIIAREAVVGDSFHRVVARDTKKKYVSTGNQIERYVGTHQGNTESFVAKVLEMVRGEAVRDEFIRSVGSGFAETEGVRIEIINKGSDQVIEMTYTLKDAKVGNRVETVIFDRTVLTAIINEWKLFEEEVAKHAVEN